METPDTHNPDRLLNVLDENTQLRLDEPPVTKAGYVKQSYHPQYSKSVVRNADVYCLQRTPPLFE